MSVGGLRLKQVKEAVAVAEEADGGYERKDAALAARAAEFGELGGRVIVGVPGHELGEMDCGLPA